MKRAIPITTLFLDIGGVPLTDGWDHHARRRAAKTFKLELAEMEDRHHLKQLRPRGRWSSQFLIPTPDLPIQAWQLGAERG